MARQIVATAGGNDIEGVAALEPDSAGGDAGAVELIVGIVHLIDTEYCFKTTLVEGLVVGHKRETGYLGFYLLPHIGEDGRIFGVGCTQAMYLTAPVVVILRFWLDERVELVHNLTVPHHDDTQEQTDDRSLLAVSKSIAAKSCIVTPPYTYSTFALSFWPFPCAAIAVRAPPGLRHS